MQLQVKVRGKLPANELNARIRRYLTRLEQRHHDVDRCRVEVQELPNESGGTLYAVALEIGVGRDRMPISGPARVDIGAALREVFEQAHTRLTAREKGASVVSDA